MSDNGTFTPVIVGFLCNWCSYRAARPGRNLTDGLSGDTARYPHHVHGTA